MTRATHNQSIRHCRNGPLSGRSDRPNMNTTQSETNIRNGFQSRQQTPQPNLPHTASSFPPPGASSFSQGGMMIQTPQPRLPPPPQSMPPSSNSDHHHQAPDRDAAPAPAAEWTTSSQRPPQLPPLPPSSRPTSASFIRTGGGELAPSTPNYTPAPNGHGPVTPVQLRQRS